CAGFYANYAMDYW
nr:immunoglobulin heavy chain junction region [Mus musculus]